MVSTDTKFVITSHIVYECILFLQTVNLGIQIHTVPNSTTYSPAQTGQHSPKGIYCWVAHSFSMHITPEQPFPEIKRITLAIGRPQTNFIYWFNKFVPVRIIYLWFNKSNLESFFHISYFILWQHHKDIIYKRR